MHYRLFVWTIFISAFEIFALMTDLSLGCIRACAVGPGSHSQNSIVGLVGIFDERHSFSDHVAPGTPGQPGMVRMIQPCFLSCW